MEGQGFLRFISPPWSWPIPNTFEPQSLNLFFTIFCALKKKRGGQICHIKRRFFLISDQPNCWFNLFLDFLRVLSIGTSGLQIGCNFPRAQSTRWRFDNIAREWRCKWSADNDKVDRQNQWILWIPWGVGITWSQFDHLSSCSKPWWFNFWKCLWFGGGFKHFFFSPRSLGKWFPIWRAYFSDGLVQPPTSWWFGWYRGLYCWAIEVDQDYKRPL